MCLSCRAPQALNISLEKPRSQGGYFFFHILNFVFIFEFSCHFFFIHLFFLPTLLHFFFFFNFLSHFPIFTLLYNLFLYYFFSLFFNFQSLFFQFPPLSLFAHYAFNFHFLVTVTHFLTFLQLSGLTQLYFFSLLLFVSFLLAELSSILPRSAGILSLIFNTNLSYLF